MREGGGGAKTVNHFEPMPEGIVPPEETECIREPIMFDSGSPFESRRIEILNAESDKPHLKKTRQWIRARGRISEEGGHEAHLSALAYMSDSYFIGTVSRIHNLWRFGLLPSKPDAPRDPKTGKVVETEQQLARRRLIELEGFGTDVDNQAGRPEVGMMVSLDHSIYFHEPREFRADEWIFTEMDSPWAGDGRGVVTQKMWSHDGRLIATCYQEGVVRLKQDGEGVKSEGANGKSKL